MVAQFDDKIGALTDAVVMQHASLEGIAQQLAEVLLQKKLCFKINAFNSFCVLIS